MDAHGLVHVNDNKVVISGLGAGELRPVELGGLLHEAEHGSNVRLPLCGGKITPKIKNEESAQAEVAWS